MPRSDAPFATSGLGIFSMPICIIKMVLVTCMFKHNECICFLQQERVPFETKTGDTTYEHTFISPRQRPVRFAQKRCVDITVGRALH